MRHHCLPAISFSKISKPLKINFIAGTISVLLPCVFLMIDLAFYAIPSVANQDAFEAPTKKPTATAIAPEGLGHGESPNRTMKPSTFMDRLLEISQTKSPDILLKAKANEQKQFAQWSSVSAWLPRVDWQISANRTNASLYTGIVGADLDYKQNVFSISLPLYKRGIHLSVLESLNDTQLSKEELLAAKGENDWQVFQLVGSTLIAEYRQAAVLKTLEAAKRTEHETKIRFEAGGRSQLDVLKTQAQLTSLESQSLSAENEIRIALDALLLKTGLNVEDLNAIGFPMGPQTEQSLEQALSALSRTSEANTESMHALFNQRLSDSPEKGKSEIALEVFDSDSRLKNSIELTAKSNELKAKMISAKDWPDLSIKASYQKIANGWSDLKDSTESRSIGLTLTVPLFNFGSGYASQREATALIEAATLQREQSLKSARQKIEQLVSQLQVLQKLISSLEIRRSQNTELERLTAKSFQLGKSTVQDYLIAQNEAINAKIDLAKAKIDLLVSEKQLAWNLGKSAK